VDTSERCEFAFWTGQRTAISRSADAATGFEFREASWGVHFVHFGPFAARMAVKDRGAGAQVEHAIHARLSNARCASSTHVYTIARPNFDNEIGGNKNRQVRQERQCRTCETVAVDGKNEPLIDAD
jgi:hypothetical protein